MKIKVLTNSVIANILLIFFISHAFAQNESVPNPYLNPNGKLKIVAQESNPEASSSMMGLRSGSQIPSIDQDDFETTIARTNQMSIQTIQVILTSLRKTLELGSRSSRFAIQNWNDVPPLKRQAAVNSLLKMAVQFQSSFQNLSDSVNAARLFIYARSETPKVNSLSQDTADRIVDQTFQDFVAFTSIARVQNPIYDARVFAGLIRKQPFGSKAVEQLQAYAAQNTQPISGGQFTSKPMN